MPDFDVLRAALMTHCRLCPRQCGSDRLSGSVGFCGAGSTVRIYRYAPHFGEEPPVSGVHGSGAVFFSHCSLNCLYCQNYIWSQQNAGDDYSIIEVAKAFRELADAGCHNWNLVSPTPWLPAVAEALDILRREGVSLPVVYNTSGYESCKTLDEFEDIIDIYLTDLRYADSVSAAKASAASDYVTYARKAFIKMWRKLGPLKCDENGIAVSGVICRLLILPGLAEEVIASLEWLAANIGTDVHISLMAQYRPAFHALEQPLWNRGITRAEYDKVSLALDRLGFENGWIQEFNGAPEVGMAGYEMPPGSFRDDRAAE